MHAETQALPVRMSQRSVFQIPLVVLGIVLGVAAWHWQTVAAMAKIWGGSETFAHGYLVVPVFAYLLWRIRDELVIVPIRPFPPALLGVLVMGFGWLLGEVAATASPAQFALIGMIIFMVWAVLGTTVLRQLAFPLAFLLFAVPFGEFLMPTLMQWTADFTVAALRAVGVPVYREGLQFKIPSGDWSVVEACSGLRYLIASMMVGCLYAFLTYRSTRKRLLFILVSIVVPLIANWLRAFMIVMLGHLSSNKLATGVDHLIYGWLFFGIVMLAMFWIGGRWREDHVLPAASVAETTQRWQALPKWPLALALIAALMWKPIAYALLKPSGTTVQLAQVEPTAGWQAQATPFTTWQPDYHNPSATSTRTFSKDGKQVAVYIGYYRDQGDERELVNVQNQLATTSNKQAKQIEWGSRSLRWAQGHVDASTALIRYNAEGLVVWHWYWVDGHMTASAYLAKAYLAWAQLRGAGDDSAVIMIYTPEEQAGGDGKADEVLNEFARDMGSQFEQALASTQAVEY